MLSLKFKISLLFTTIIITTIFILSCSLSPHLVNLPLIQNGNTEVDSETNNRNIAIFVDSPTNYQIIYQGYVNIKGRTVGDVKEIWIIIDGFESLCLDGASNWETNLVMSMGNYELKAYAIDYSSNYSLTNTVRFIVGGKYVFVSTNGDDSNNGILPSLPVRSINKALEIANLISYLTNVEIKVGSGVYTPGSGLDTNTFGMVVSRPNILISGGWDENFSNVVSTSELSNNTSILTSMLCIKNTSNVTLRNLIIYSSFIYPTLGIYVSNSYYVTVESNVTVSNCSEGLFSEILDHGRIFTRVRYCLNGIHLKFTTNTKVATEAEKNNIGVYLENSEGVLLDGTISGNTERGILVSSSTSNLIKANVYLNNVGGGIRLINSPSNIISGKVYSNIIPFIVEGTYIPGGGIYIENSPYTTLLGEVYHNEAPFGGGIYISGSDYFTNLGWITNNKALDHIIGGGGIFTNLPHTNSYFGNVLSNSPNDFNS